MVRLDSAIIRERVTLVDDGIFVLCDEPLARRPGRCDLSEWQSISDLESDVPVPLQVDGDPAGFTPASIEVSAIGCLVVGTQILFI